MLSSHPTLSFGDVFRRKAPDSVRLLSMANLNLTYHGRGALYRACQLLGEGGGGTVLVPAFHCPTVVDPVLQSGLRARYYRINSDLSSNLEDLASKIDNGVVAIIVINYFGFPSDLRGVQDACGEHSPAIIEDCAHSFLYTDPIELTGGRGDISIYSFKKLAPSLVGGGFLCSPPFEISRYRGRPVPIRYTVSNLMALLGQALDNLDAESLAKRTYDRANAVRKSMKRDVSAPRAEDQVQQLEFEYPFDLRLEESRMPIYAKAILLRAQLQRNADCRRENYQAFLDANLTDRVFDTVFDYLPDRVCPWALPIRIDGRSGLDLEFRSVGVPVFTFGETLHKSFHESCSNQPHMYETAIRLSRTLLCVPVYPSIDKNEVRRWHTVMKSKVAIVGGTTQVGDLA